MSMSQSGNQVPNQNQSPSPKTWPDKLLLLLFVVALALVVIGIYFGIDKILTGITFTATLAGLFLKIMDIRPALLRNALSISPTQRLVISRVTIIVLLAVIISLSVSTYQAIIQRPSTSIEQPTPAVYQMLSQLCVDIRTGNYQQAYSQFTTAGYKRSNSSPEVLSFKSLGGIIECVPPTPQNIALASPYLTHCYVQLRRADSGQQFNHKFDLTNTEGGVWKIYQDDSTTDAENALLPQCGNFPS